MMYQSEAYGRRGRKRMNAMRCGTAHCGYEGIVAPREARNIAMYSANKVVVDARSPKKPQAVANGRTALAGTLTAGQAAINHSPSCTAVRQGKGRTYIYEGRDDTNQMRTGQ